MTQTTNKLIVISVSDRGAIVAVNGTNKLVTWSDLMDAASGENDRDLREVYSSLLREAREMVSRHRGIPVEVGVATLTGHSSYYSFARDCSGQSRNEFRPADADGQQTLPECEFTAREMAERARRRGYKVADLGRCW